MLKKIIYALNEMVVLVATKY